ncbi:hypothetical protein GUJ93_ZPchr0002g26564 [Zizania palustris]|uniref:Rx N-terminal domain-containing protein n=1 Tax=Zizania palustris TaxID=103762 RepID=A0A8J5VFJ5_ZIZPA|nr:hypothetical protein GUJ93_ZPchr0002g26564 [Zizania palustris]
MGLAGTVVDAAIGWMVETILGSFFSPQMQKWTHQVGLAEDVAKLESEMKSVQTIVGAAEGRRIGNRTLSDSLHELKELLYDAEDVMDEIDYYRLQQHIEGKGSHVAAASTNPEASCASSSYSPSLYQRVRISMNRIISLATTGRKRKRDDDEPTQSLVLPLDIKHDISNMINGIVNRLSIVGKSVQGALQLEILGHNNMVSNQWQSVARSSRQTTSIPIERKVYGRDVQRDNIVEILMKGKTNDLGVLPLVATGCMILATTRMSSVARMIGTMSKVEVNGLDETEFWSLFKSWAFLGSENQEADLALQSIGNQIAKTLKGIPLAARSVGALLNRSVSFAHWRNVQSKWKSLLDQDDDILTILKFSYEFLPVHLQHCFSYCSLFPKDYRFNEKTLVYAWISQNFVKRECHTEILEETGKQYLDNLVGWGFFEEFESHYVMHDLMHDLAQEVSSNECATLDILHPKKISPILLMPILQYQLELTFKVQDDGNFNISQIASLNELITLGISQLENVKTKEEAKSARLIDKEHLKELSLSWNDNIMSPETTEDKTRDDVLEGLEPHQNLKHLKLSLYSGSTSPSWLAKVTSLKVLHLENCREWKIFQSLETLPALRKLKLIRMWNLMEASIPSFLEELVLVNMPKLEKCVGTYGLDLTSNLSVLMVKDCPQLSEFTLFHSNYFHDEQKSRFPSLKELTIGHCHHIIAWKTLPLEEMRALKKLELIDVPAIEELSVPCLEELVLMQMPSLQSCNGISAAPSSLHLEFSRVNGGFGGCTSLERLLIDGCPKLVSSLVTKTNDDLLLPTSLQHLRINPLPENLQSFVPEGMACLKKLRLRSSQYLKSVQLDSCKALEYLGIWDCPQLGVLEGLQHLSSLQSLHIEMNPELFCASDLKLLFPLSLGKLKIEYLQDSLVHSGLLCLPSITKLGLYNSPDLKSLQLGYCTSLEHLKISRSMISGVDWKL